MATVRSVQDLDASRIMKIAALAWVALTSSIFVVCRPLLGNGNEIEAAIRGAGMRWGAAEATLLVVAFFATASAAYVVTVLSAQLSISRALAWRCGTPIAALLVVLGLHWYSVSNQTTEGLIAKIESQSGVLVTSATRVTDALAEIASVTILAACYLITRRDAAKHIGIEDYKSQHHLYSLLLYASAALLCIGLLEIHALFAWAATVDKGAAPLASAFPIVAGMLFTSLLAVLLGPAAFRLHTIQGDLVLREAQDARSRSESFDPAKWLATHGASASPLLTTTTMLSPMLTGFLAGAFKSVA